jgi:soluble lytic murein transglycosylase
LNYRLKDYSSAQAEFERLLAQSQIGLLELPARYWLWRSLQTQNIEGAKEQQEELIRKFPFSYYGLRARIEANGGFVEWKIEKAKEKLSSKVWLSEGERLTWKRVQALLKAGWLEEAQKELADLPAVSKSGDKAIRALLWAAAGQFTASSRLANEAWDEAPELRVTSLVQAAYPQVFPDLVQAQAAKRKLDPMLVRSLIKQESGFNPRALSSSNAMGLMQLMMPTAREMAQELKLGAMAKAEDVQVPARNVQMGSLYLSRLLNKYSGSVPLALAGYNAGPARIDRWMKLRASLKGIAERRSSQPDDEIWFDELPYQETSVYVKAILRNLIIYKMLDQGRVQVSEPIWSNGAERESAGPVHVAPPGRRRLACFERLSQNTTRQSQVCQ